jgi:hypothetical protein
MESASDLQQHGDSQQGKENEEGKASEDIGRNGRLASFRCCENCSKHSAPFDSCQPTGWLVTGLTVARNDVGRGGQFGEPHRPAGVHLLRANTNFSAEAKFATISEPR